MSYPNHTAQFPPDSITVSDLRTYLVARGWISEPFRRQEELKFVIPKDHPLGEAVLLIPSREDLRDYESRISLAVRSLSVLEDRPVEYVVRDIITPTCDKLDVRLQTAEVRTGTLLLGFATQFFDGVKNLLTFAACAEHDPRPYFPRAFKDAVDFANRCRLAGTSPGSFRVTLEAQLPPPASQMQQELSAFPKERRILLGLMQGLAELRQAHDAAKTDSVVSDQKFRINANICDAILAMRPDTDDAVVDILATWSPAWPTENRMPSVGVSFNPRSFETVRAVSQAFRTGEESKRRAWQGKVVSCIAEDPLGAQASSTMIKIRVENYSSPLKIEIRLTTDDYRRAVRAHLDGKSVRVTGVLDKGVKKATLLNPSDFSVLD